MNKKKGHRSQVKKGYYERQRAKTSANKARRAAKRRNKAAFWAKKKADEAKAKYVAVGGYMFPNN